MISKTNADHELIWLNTSEEICLKQIEKRRIEKPERAAFDTPEIFHEVTKFFEEPSKDEGLNINKVTWHA